MSDDERQLVGFFGEAIAFEWLKRKYGRRRLVNEECWASENREHLFPGKGNDALGYDFEVVNGSTHWFFEVKATTAPGPLAEQFLNLGASQFRRAEQHKADRRSRFRILFVTNALFPERARIFVLPNPRTKAGLAFFSDRDADRRLYFPLKV